MRILQPNTGKENVMILKNHLYVYITDYKTRFFLKQIKIMPGQILWHWIPFKVDKIIDLTENHNLTCSFEIAINKAVNDAYSTVYEFEDYDEMVKHWDDIKYVDNITTVYKSEIE